MRDCNLIIALILLIPGICLSQTTVEKGETLYSHWCSHCHGDGQVASVYLEKKYNGQIPGVLEERTDLAAEFVKLRIRKSIPGMPAFRPTELSDQDVEEITAYLVN